LSEAWRVLKAGAQILLVEYASDPATGKGFVASHGIHGRFDLDRLLAPRNRAGYRDVGSGPTAWSSLHYLRGRKPSTVV